MSTALTAPEFSPATRAAHTLTTAATPAVAAVDVPRGPGLFGLVADAEAQRVLGRALGEARAFEHVAGLLHIGHAADVSRAARSVFHAGRTATVGVRQRLAALLADELGLAVAPVSAGVRRPGVELTSDSEERLSAWLREHVGVRTWQDGDACAEVHARVVADVAPVLTGAQVPGRVPAVDAASERLRAARPSATL